MTPTSRLGVSILGAALALGILGDALLRATPWGVNVALWTGLLVGALVGLARAHRVDLTGGGRWLVIPTLFFAAAFAWRASPTLNVLNLLAALVALALAALRSRAGRIRVAGIREYAMAQFLAASHALFGAFSLLSADVQWKAIPRAAWSKQALAVGRGLVIGAPLVLVFGALFAAADAVFEDFAFRLFDWDVDVLLTDMFFIGAWAWISAGFLRQTLMTSGLATSAGDKKTPLSLGAIEINTALGLLNALFFAFVLVQLGYFFGGAQVVIASRTLTYAEYARRGFFELVAVVALVLPTLLIAHWLLPKDNSRAERTFRGLAGALIAMLFVIMASAVQRMWLYQREFGLTELRLYTTAFMGWLAIVFVWLVATVLRGRRDQFAFGALVAGFAVIVGLHLLNPDDLITRVNAGRVNAPNPFDARYFTLLSADAVPALIDVLPGMQADDQCYVAAQLLLRWSPPESVDWRTWNLSRAQAQLAVEANRPALLALACPAR